MSDVVICPKCESKNRIPQGYAGRRVRCAVCGAQFELPEARPQVNEDLVLETTPIADETDDESSDDIYDFGEPETPLTDETAAPLPALPRLPKRKVRAAKSQRPTRTAAGARGGSTTSAASILRSRTTAIVVGLSVVGVAAILCGAVLVFLGFRRSGPAPNSPQPAVEPTVAKSTQESPEREPTDEEVLESVPRSFLTADDFFEYKSAFVKKTGDGRPFTEHRGKHVKWECPIDDVGDGNRGVFPVLGHSPRAESLMGDIERELTFWQKAKVAAEKEEKEADARLKQAQKDGDASGEDKAREAQSLAEDKERIVWNHFMDARNRENEAIKACGETIIVFMFRNKDDWDRLRQAFEMATKQHKQLWATIEGILQPGGEIKDAVRLRYPRLAELRTATKTTIEKTEEEADKITAKVKEEAPKLRAPSQEANADRSPVDSDAAPSKGSATSEQLTADEKRYLAAIVEVRDARIAEIRQEIARLPTHSGKSHKNNHGQRVTNDAKAGRQEQLKALRVEIVELESGKNVPDLLNLSHTVRTDSGDEFPMSAQHYPADIAKWSASLSQPGALVAMKKELTVVQVVGPSDMLATFKDGAGTRDFDRTFWLHGFPTGNLVDGKTFWFQELFVVDGTKTYETSAGGSRTVFVYRPLAIDREKVLAEYRARSKPAEPEATVHAKASPKLKSETKPAESTDPENAARKQFAGILANARSLIKAGLRDTAKKDLLRIVKEVPGTTIAKEAQRELDDLDKR